MRLESSKKKQNDEENYFSPHELAQVEPSLIEALRFPDEDRVRQNRSNETRKNIISCAIEAYAIAGYGSVSSYDIAARAGVTQGLITYHFKSKEGIWKAVMDELFGDLRNSLTKRIHELREVETAQGYKLIIRHFIRWSASNPFLPRLIVEEAHDQNTRIEWLCERHIKPVHSVFHYLLKTGQEAGFIRQGDLTSLFYILVDSVMIFATSDEVRLVAKKDVLTSKFVETHADNIINLFFIDNGSEPNT